MAGAVPAAEAAPLPRFGSVHVPGAKGWRAGGAQGGGSAGLAVWAPPGWHLGPAAGDRRCPGLGAAALPRADAAPRGSVPQGSGWGGCRPAWPLPAAPAESVAHFLKDRHPPATSLAPRSFQGLLYFWPPMMEILVSGQVRSWVASFLCLI